MFFEGAVIQKIGCTAKIQSVVRHYDDGCMDILTRGERRFVIKDMDKSRSFLQARVLFFDDEAEAAADGDSELRADVLRLLEDCDRLSKESRDYDALANMDPGILSFVIPGLEGFAPQERQPFLETTSPRRQLQKWRGCAVTGSKCHSNPFIQPRCYCIDLFWTPAFARVTILFKHISRIVH